MVKNGVGVLVVALVIGVLLLANVVWTLSNEVKEEGLFRTESNIKLISEQFNIETSVSSNRRNLYNFFEKNERRRDLDQFIYESNPFLNEQLIGSKVNSLKRSLNENYRSLQQHLVQVVLKVTDLKELRTFNAKLSLIPIAKNVVSTTMSWNSIQELLEKTFVEWIGQVDPIFKFDIQDFFSTNQQSTVDLVVQYQEDGEFLEYVKSVAFQFNVELIRHQSPGLLSVIVKSNLALGLAYEISKHSSVIWLEPIKSLKVDNKFAKNIVNDGTQFQNVQFGGLTGATETVTVVDGGLDVNSCFFTDPNNKVTEIRSYEEGLQLTPSQINAHRKIKVFFAMVDNRTVDNDHGSHVSGSVAGNSLVSSLTDYNGIAPDAKLAFVQIGCNSKDGCVDTTGRKFAKSEGDVFAPVDPYNILHSFSYSVAKSRIESNSWGGPGSYNYYASRSDQFIFENKDMIILRSAGNSGERGFKSISAEAQGKNVITVGASHNSYNARVEQYNKFTYSTFATARDTILSGLLCDSVEPVSKEACAYFSNQDNIVDVCDETGYCEFKNTTKSTGACGCAISGIGDEKCGRCQLALLVKQNLQPDSVTEFSSRGPTKDGRIKPDIVVPGDVILSARSSSTEDDIGKSCFERKNPIDSVMANKGTSTSTPIAAGLVAILLQYFKEGYFVDGLKNLKIGFTPSASLVKATMVNSAVDLLSVSNDNNLLETLSQRNINSTRYQGFGRVQLDNVLQFGKNQRRLWFGRTDYIQNMEELSNVRTEYGDPVLTNIEDEHVYYLSPANPKSPMKNVKITLAWSDYPASLTARNAIVNDLDLEVDINRDLIYGNSQLKGLTQTNMVRDSLNNVEQVWVDEYNHGVVIRVYADYLFLPQSYSLVVSGDNVIMQEFLRE